MPGTAIRTCATLLSSESQFKSGRAIIERVTQMETRSSALRYPPPGLAPARRLGALPTARKHRRERILNLLGFSARRREFRAAPTPDNTLIEQSVSALR